MTSDTSLVLRPESGRAIPGDAWAGAADAVDRGVLDRCRGPVLDIGCGPGRHVLAIAERGLPVLGVDLTPRIVAWARQRGALVIERCVFDRVPGAGRWGTVLLLDGNIGIGGDPTDLLLRARELIAPDGGVLVETASPDARDAPGVRTRAWLEVDGVQGPSFAWTSVDAQELAEHGRAAGLASHDDWTSGDRRFVELRRTGGRARP